MTSRCNFGQSFSEKSIYPGPLLPSGKFRTRDSDLPVTGFRFPRATDFKAKPLKSKTEPLAIAPCLLDSKRARMISNGPSRKDRKKFPKGAFNVHPERTCVSNFRRRMHALDMMIHSVNEIGHISLFNPKFLRNLKSYIHMLPQILWNMNNSDTFGIQKFRNCLGFSLRKNFDIGQLSPTVNEEKL